MDNEEVTDTSSSPAAVVAPAPEPEPAPAVPAAAAPAVEPAIASAPAAASASEATAEFDRLFSAVKQSVASRKLSPSNIVIVATQAMQLVERSTALSGPEKKELVVSVLERLIDELPTVAPQDANDYRDLLMFVKVSLPSVIDAIVAASRQKLSLNKLGQSSCFACCRRRR
ncbi:Hypothetical protein UVM_LOCUS74 [uncultured virus]|nr:Hypothetical protein UVM_LOCUS74 [uncultured virus]